jgi:hypothetical protein
MSEDGRSAVDIGRQERIIQVEPEPQTVPPLEVEPIPEQSPAEAPEPVVAPAER